MIIVLLKTIKPLAQAKAKGFSDVLFLDSVTGKYIEEVSACNIFMLKVFSHK